jgi:hypothetical protein
MAFGITVEDVRAVLLKNVGRTVSEDGRSLDTNAVLIYHGLTEEEMDEIAFAAMDAYIDGQPEDEAAQRALQNILVKRGLIDISLRANTNSYSRRARLAKSIAIACL